LPLSENDYSKLKPVYSICLLEGTLWAKSTKVHHAFRLTDEQSGRTLINTLEIHTLELGWYNLCEADLPSASPLDRWIFWLLHAEEYDREGLLKLFPEQAFQMATRILTRISETTEDEQMYDSREKAIRDSQWALNASRNEGIADGEIKGEIRLIRMLEDILQIPTSDENNLAGKSLEELQVITLTLQSKVRSRTI